MDSIVLSKLRQELFAFRQRDEDGWITIYHSRLNSETENQMIQLLDEFTKPDFVDYMHGSMLKYKEVTFSTFRFKVFMYRKRRENPWDLFVGIEYLMTVKERFGLRDEKEAYEHEIGLPNHLPVYQYNLI